MANSDTCIHQPRGLCPQCQADRDEDPVAWLEFGAHTDGLRQLADLQAEIDTADDRPQQPMSQGSDIPF